MTVLFLEEAGKGRTGAHRGAQEKHGLGRQLGKPALETDGLGFSPLALRFRMRKVKSLVPHFPHL